MIRRVAGSCVPAVLAACALVLTASPAFAQGLGFGGKAGVNLTKVTFDQDEGLDVTGKPGAVGGGYVTLPLFGRLRLEVDVLYSQRKSEFAEAGVVDTLTYVELPIVVTWPLITRERWRVLAVVGGVVSILQSARERISGVDYDIKSTAESQETAAAIGGQVQLGRLIFDVRYLYGLSNVYRAADFPAKHRGMQITAGYKIK